MTTFDDVRLKPGPAPKYDICKVYIEAMRIQFEEGFPEGGLTALGHKIQLSLGDEAPGDTLMKQMLAPLKRHPVLKHAFPPTKKR